MAAPLCILFPPVLAHFGSCRLVTRLSSFLGNLRSVAALLGAALSSTAPLVSFTLESVRVGIVATFALCLALHGILDRL